MKRTVFLPLLGISFIATLLIDTTYFNEVGAWVMLAIGFVLLLSFVFYKDQNDVIARIYFRPIHLFLFSFAVVAFQSPIDILLGYNMDYYLVGPLKFMPEAVKISLLGLIAFLSGYIINKRKKCVSANVEQKVLYASTTPYKVLMSLTLIIIYVFIPKNLLYGGYASAALAESGYKYIMTVCTVFYCAFFIQYAINTRLSNRGEGWSIFQFVKDIGWWQNINMFIYILLILNVGDRGPLIDIIVLYYIVYIAVTGICPSKKKLLVGFICGVLAMAFLGYTKNFRDGNSIFERIETTWEANPYEDLQESILPTTYELSLSYRCLSYSIADIEANGNYGYGKYQLTYIISVIPFVSKLVDLSNVTSTYISHLIQGDFLTYGNGTSVIADFYLDWGVIGVIICMFLFGYCVKWFDLILFAKSSSSLFLYCAAFYISVHFISIPRAFLLIYLRHIVWLTVILYAHQRISNRT